MDIKDAYLHSTVGVVKSINVDKDNIIYKLADVANTTNSIALPLVTSEYNGLVPKITTTTTRASHNDRVLSASSDGKLNWRLFPTYYKQYTSLDSLPTDGSLEAWYDIAQLHDTQHMDSNCIFVIKAYAHSSAIFTVCKGWDQTGNITLLSYCSSYNANYAYVKGARINKDGVVQILLNVPKAEPGYVQISIGVYGAMGIQPNQTLSLSSEIDEDSIIDTKLFVNNSMMAKKFVGDLIGNADSSTNAQNINVGALNTNGDYPLLFTQNVTSGNKKIYTDTETALSYNPSTNTLKAKALEIATGDLILQTQSNGNTPSIIFRRGTLNDAPIDWRVYNNSSGQFTIQGNTGEEGWVNMLTLEHASYGNALKSSLPILPTKNNVLDLGSNAAKWANIYSQSFVGNYLTAKTGNLTLEANSSQYIYLRVGTDDTSSIALTSQALLPTYGSKNILNLGSASNKWKSVYATEFVGDLTGTASKWKHDYDWDAVCTIGLWSKILNITGYTSILLSCQWGRTAQVILNTYLITTGYQHAKIIQLNSNGYPSNAGVELRVTSSDTNKFCVEVLNNHSTNTPEITFKCRAISIGRSDTSIVPIEIFTEGSDTVKSSLVSSKSISSNLNADMLDGAHLSELLRIYDHSKTSLDLVNSPSNSPALFDLENNNLIEGYYNFWYVFNIGRHNEGNFNSQIAVPYQNAIKDSELFIRTANNTTWREWRRVLHSNNYTDYTVSKDGTGATGTWNIDISGTAATATKLATKRKLWGQDFDGSADVNGSLTGVTSINMNGDIVINDGTNKDRFIKFQYANGDNYGWRIGYLGDNTVNGSNNNALSFESYNNSTWNKALIFNHSTRKATFSADVTAPKFIGNLTGNITGDVTGNADTATKLQTKRKLWGQDFDGTADVKGSLSYVINIIAESGKALTLATPSGSDSSIYLRYNSDDTKSVCLISNAFIPTTASSNILNLGSVNNKWKGVYASNFYGNLNGSYVNALTGYTKATAIGSITATDSLNTALGKLEYKTDFIYNDLFGTDNDDVINKWSEIVNFIDSVKETETDILDTFVTRKTDQVITGKKTFTTSINLSNLGGNALTGMSRASLMYDSYTSLDSTKYHPILGIQTNGGNVINLGAYVDKVGFYGYYNGRIDNGWDWSFLFDSTNGALTHSGHSITAVKFKTKNGTSSQFVKGDGSLDSNTYATTASLGNYVTLNTDQTITGQKTFDKTLIATNNLTIKSKAVNQTPRIVFDEYWTSTNPSWKSEIISDYYGKNVCSTDNFTHGLYVKLGRSTFDNFIILNNYGEPIARISKDKGHWFDGTLTATNTITSPRFIGSFYTKWVDSINKAGCANSNLGWFSMESSSVQSDTIGFPCTNNANGILWLGTHAHDSDSTKIGYGHQLGFSGNGKIYHRYIASGTFPTTNTWKQLAFIPDIPTKVSQLTNDSGYLTSRGYIGTTAVQESSQNQSLTGINDLTLSGNLTIIPYNTDNFITFSYENKTPLSWRLGYLGTGNGDANYFVIQSSKATGTSWNNAIRLGNETLDAAFGGNVYPLLNNTQSLGTSTYKWANVYATTFTGNLTGNVNGNVSGSSGSCTGNAATATTLKPITAISAKAFSLSNASWTDTGYTFANLETGTYAVQVTSGTNLVASGIMSVYKNLSDSIGDEIPLHVYGTAGWRPYLRTFQNKLQISSNDKTAVSGGRTVTIKIARIL